VSSVSDTFALWHRRFPFWSDSAAWVAARPLLVLGLLGLPLYGLVLVHGDFRPRRMEPFFPLFFALFALYALACFAVLARRAQPGRSMTPIWLFAIAFNLLLIPSRPSLSDDMYRYIWDGRVQAAGINPYRYPSNAPELETLRDADIWQSMNRPDAVTIYPPGAQMIFAATWRIFPDSVAGMKLVLIGATLAGGWLLVRLLRAGGQPPERALIYLWNPLLIFEIAHAAHVDALYLPLIIGAFLLRARAPADRADWRYEAGIGVLLGLGVLVKLYPAILAPCLWSVRTADGRRQWRLALPVALGLTVLAGYTLYIEPGVNALGFLPSYGREFFNVSPLMRLLTDWAIDRRIGWWTPGNYGMPALIALTSAAFVLFPARTARAAILRCFVPMGIYILVNHNLFSWYVLWLLPLVALALDLRPLRLNTALAWWVFSGTVALSYIFFVRWREEAWAIYLQFLPLYGLLLLAGWRAWRQRRSAPVQTVPYVQQEK
jgi:hypothetical protein